MNKLALIAFILLIPTAVFAQEEQRVDKIERRMMALEQKLFTTPAYLGGSAADGTMLADLEARMQNLEDESSRVYGSIEELGHSVNQLAKKLDLISEDFELRMQDIETAITELKKAPKPSPAPPRKEVSKPTPKAEEKPAVKPEVKAEPKAAAPVPAKISEADAGGAAPAEKMAEMSVEDLYNKAYDNLVATKYADAEKYFKEFTEKHADHELASSAYYWLGETYMVQDKYEQAVVTFSTGLSQFPEGAKAPSNLLKMGIAFKSMGKNDFAKGAWMKLQQDFADTPEAEKAKQELESLEPAAQ